MNAVELEKWRLTEAEVAPEDEEWRRLQHIQMHDGRLRRRSSVIPSVHAIVEDPYRECT